MQADKSAIRERIWSAIDDDPAIGRPPGARGRIPNFAGAEQAARLLWSTPEWQRARVIKLNPDTPQHALRERAVEDGKLVYVAVPRLTDDRPFIALERARLGVPAREVATKEGAARHGVPTRLEDMAAVDLIVCGSVAVSRSGVRVGKGGGYADLEFALLAELGKVSESTVIATSVHDVQLCDEPLPETTHDFRVDLVATPSALIRCPRAPRPRGVVWEDLDLARLPDMPVLRAWHERRSRSPA